MTAIERTSELRTKLNSLLVAQKRAEEISSLRPIAQGLEGVARKLESVRDAGVLLKDAEITVAVGQSELTKLAKLFEKARDLADNDAFSLTKGKTYDSLRNESEDLCRGFTTQALSAWKAYLVEHDSTLDVELVETLGKLSVNTAKIRKYRELKNRLISLSQELPDSRSKIDAANEVIRDLHDAVSSLPLEQLDDAVKAFLQSVQTNGGADLAMLTPVVEKWCKENGVWHRLRVRVS